jgi:hypothetical protein
MMQINDSVFQHQTAILMMGAYLFIALCLISISIKLFIQKVYIPMGPAGLGLMLIGYAVTRYKFSFENAGVVSMDVIYWQGASAIVGIASGILCVVATWFYFKHHKN